jgi:hypothetical protein
MMIRSNRYQEGYNNGWKKAMEDIDISRDTIIEECAQIADGWARGDNSPHRLGEVIRAIKNKL